MTYTAFTPESETGEVEVTAYAKDEAGNPPWLFLDIVFGRSASFTFPQAKKFVQQLTDAIAAMEKEPDK